MFDIIFGAVNALYLAGAVIGNVILWPDQMYDLHKTREERDTVSVISFHPQWYKSDAKCRYTGVLVPYVRDWPETVKHGDQEEVIPPDLEHTAGHAIILDKKVCPGQADQSVFLVDEVQRNIGRIAVAESFHFSDPAELRPEYRPKWMPQVLQRIQLVAERDANTRQFFDELSAIQTERAQKAAEAAAASNTFPAAPSATASTPETASAPAASGREPVTNSEPVKPSA
ncbi:hypothetical protein AB3X82_23335 [Paraburkholderia phenoliruptrix]|uniref:Uncharacterized protein n=1 Tax=Paraburkholderia phenoliruptrix TaxID=252970 RepID=A0ABV3WIE5_9BURK